MRSALFVMVLAVGCADDPPGPIKTPEIFPADQLFVSSYTGGPPPGRVTIRALDLTSVTWSSADPGTATITGTTELGTVTAVQVGSTTIDVNADGSAFHIPLTVNGYTATQLS